ncbi:DNA oxidative demethylase AlkB [Variovorax sp. GT1P44]|uniref:DNA oxidative demethylase AlkB n=1 Tax=Variovorax sp. GT1P44 TaxID=3443742 RepID=UPI003F481529
MTLDLFDLISEPGAAWVEALEPGAMVLRQFARPYEGALLDGVRQLIDVSPLRHMVTPGGFRMSVAMTNCGEMGWVTDRSGYRYDPIDPETGRPWPRMPAVFSRLAAKAAAEAGFRGFEPDACLVNRYEAGTRLSLHQDRDERDFGQPIVSVSLGIPAVFLFGGSKRTDKARRVPLGHGDVVVWGGPARLHHHGVLPLKEGTHPFMGDCRVNLTFRKAG